jgi:hypothetical protein
MLSFPLTFSYTTELLLGFGRMIRGVVVLVTVSLLASGCAKSKPSDASPSASSSAALAAGSTAPLAARPPARNKLCSDGFHKPGDHWKEQCNPCRCAADGEITCAHFPCPNAGPVEAGARPDAGAAP